jgi:hypothetical protein
MANQQKSQ